MAKETQLLKGVEARTQEIGRSVWTHLHRRRPSMFERRWWDDRILGVAMADESVKVQMFRFVDVLPRLRSHQDVTRHLQEYFEEIREYSPWAVELVKFGVEHLRPESVLSRALAYNARRNAARMAQRFIAGSNVDEVLQAVTALRQQGFAFTLDLLGEAVISEAEAEAYQRHYLDLITGLSENLNRGMEFTQADCDHEGPIPRVNVSVKLSALVSHFRPIDPLGTSAAVKNRLRPLLRAAQAQHAYVHVDMEQYSFKDLTLKIFQEILLEDEFRDFADVGIVVQAYLQDAERDLQDLLAWVKQRGTPVWVRLVKGAYWDFETVISATHNWPVPVFQEKWESDASYEKLTRFLLENYQQLRPAFGSHNLRSLSHAIAWAEALNVPQGAYEIQMLYGMAGEQAQVFVEQGHRVRIYTPFGELMPGMAYLVRRLLENTSNDSFLRHSYDDQVKIEDLLMKPADVAKTKSAAKPPAIKLEFVNEPHTDFSKKSSREAMERALEHLTDQLGEDYSIVIGGKAIQTRKWITSRNPSHSSQIVGRIAAARTDDALAAIDAARRAFTEWSRVDASYRAEYLELMAREMRTRRYDLNAWQVYECGKPWDEADADVAEAIDFCVYYAQQMRQLATGNPFDLPGEENRYFYRPRGVAVVIAPWNFPLAILTGMTAAALVAGNTIIMKPAEQSSIVAAKLMEIVHAAGIPDGVINFLPGIGEEIGPVLTGSPDVDLIVFTGSRPVGLSIFEQAGQTHAAQHGIKHVIAELGGKNAIIVDSDADLDEAVLGVLHSAFGYAGQKCSACSRVIVLADAYDEFVKRLVEAAKALKIGPAEEAGTMLGPVIDAEAAARIREYIEVGKTEGRLLYEGDVGKLAKEGSYIAPHIFVDVPPQSRIAQEEIFGPVLVAFRAKDFGEALSIANGTDYALTGGCYSRSPANLKRVRQEFLVGNLYINRPITGALVARQPFGGYKMSGIGSKAGGPDYLHQFLIPVNITENTMRRGFAPKASE